MIEHLTFIFYIILFSISTIGYGFIFSKIIDNDLLKYNIGWQGIIGFFTISLLSILTSFFFAHSFLHNSLLHLIGIGSFLKFSKQLKNLYEIKNLFFLILILWIGTYVFKNHDDFPYYHLTYSLNLSENAFVVGAGNFSHGFRTFSSLFYYHSILYMPLINFYLFHIGPFFILLFFNYILIQKIFENFNSKNFNFIYFFSLLSFIFINVVFYRIGEHGTDRSAQILLILIFLLFFEINYFEKKKKNLLLKVNLLLILVFLSSSMKALYYLYLALVPIIIFRKKIFFHFFEKKNYLLIFVLFISLVVNLLTFYLNTGCFLYPAEKTCLVKQEWSIPKDEVKTMSIHYEWWAKAGGGPGYKHELTKQEYVKNFVWLENWIDKHFFNKVTDTLFGIIFICLLVFFLFWFCKIKKEDKYKNQIGYLPYLLIFLFTLEWFLNHPAMRYGGYVLIALPLMILTASKISNFNVRQNKVYILTLFLICLTFITYNIRNTSRIIKETKVYNYDLFKSPYFFIDDVNSKKVASNKDFSIYQPQENKMCWASKTPCSYGSNIKVKKYLWMNMVSRDD